MENVYNRNVDIGQPFAADLARLQIPDLGADGSGGDGEGAFLIQNVDVTYRQNVTRLWEVGSPKQYFIGGRPEGGFSFGRVLGPVGISTTFFEKYGDVCQVKENNMSVDMQPGTCVPGGSSVLTLGGCVLTQVAYKVQAQDMVISETLSGMFINLIAGS